MSSNGTCSQPVALLDRPAGLDPQPSASFGSVLRDGRFCGLLAVSVLSEAGDQVLRVALAVLVLARTGSAPATALVYAATFLPQLAGGLAVGLADRWPRRRLMVGCDVLRALLVAGAALPGLPLPLLTLLVVLVVGLAAPFEAARSAVVPDVLQGPAYATGSALQNVALQVGMFGGFAAGGLLVSLAGVRSAVLIDAATFALSALVVQLVLAGVPAARSVPLRQQPGEPPESYLVQLRAGASLVITQAWLRWLALLACTVTGGVVLSEGLVAPYAQLTGGGARAVGALTASAALGAVVGGAALARLVTPQRRLELMVPLAAGSGLPLLGCAFTPPLVVSCLLWGLAGAGLSFNIAANAAFVHALAPSERGRAFGLVAAALQVSQGIAVLLGALLSALVGTGPAIAVGGALATGCALALGACRPPARTAPPAAPASADRLLRPAAAGPVFGDPGPRTVDLTTVDLTTVDLTTVDLTTVGLTTVGLTTVDLTTVGLTAVGLTAVGLTAVDLMAVDLTTVDLTAVVLARGDLPGGVPMQSPEIPEALRSRVEIELRPGGRTHHPQQPLPAARRR